MDGDIKEVFVDVDETNEERLQKIFDTKLATYDRQVEEAYKKALLENKSNKTPTISLNQMRSSSEQREERITLLKGKLDEYKQRLAMNSKNNPDSPLGRISAMDRYKRDLLRITLNGEVQPLALAQAYEELAKTDHNNFDYPNRPQIDSAARIIEDYIVSGGIFVKGGTGLPHLNRIKV